MNLRISYGRKLLDINLIKKSTLSEGRVLFIINDYFV